MNIGIYVFNNAEVLDFAGPFEVFTTATRVARHQQPDQPRPFDVFSISQDGKPVTLRAGLVIQPDHSLTSHPMIDLLLVPGGIVTEQLKRPEVIDWIRKTNSNTQLTASVCTGAMLLASAGLLDGRSATTHWEDLAELQTSYPQVKVLAERRWVDEGHIVTSAGISAGIDMCLHLVERLAGRTLAEATARQMEYDWRNQE